jgi:hypothetical protein
MRRRHSPLRHMNQIIVVCIRRPKHILNILANDFNPLSIRHVNQTRKVIPPQPNPNPNSLLAVTPSAPQPVYL